MHDVADQILLLLGTFDEVRIEDRRADAGETITPAAEGAVPLGFRHRDPPTRAAWPLAPAFEPRRLDADRAFFEKYGRVFSKDGLASMTLSDLRVSDLSEFYNSHRVADMGFAAMAPEMTIRE